MFRPQCTVETTLITLPPSSVEEIQLLVGKSSSKACPLDPLPTWLLKEHLGPLLPAITRIINLSLETGVVPARMKETRVIPLIKKPSLDHEEPKNFRPVSNLSFLSKLTERVVLARLLDHVSRNGLLETFQSAYRANHS